MKTKLLKRLRAESRLHYGVFKNENGSYEVVHEKNLVFPALAHYGNREYCQDTYEVVEVVDDPEEAKKLCDGYRRGFILRRVMEMRYGNQRRFY